MTDTYCHDDQRRARSRELNVTRNYTVHVLKGERDHVTVALRTTNLIYNWTTGRAGS